MTNGRFGERFRILLRWQIAAGLVLALLIAAGCGSKSGPTGELNKVTDVGLERARIGDLFTKWEAALESYDVQGMLAPIANDAVISIRENGLSQPSKEYDTLRSELLSNETNQLRMRAEDGYEIDISFNLVISVDTKGTARAVGSFATVESIKDVAGTLIQESGTIDVELDKADTSWFIRKMDLNFNVEQP